MVIKERAFAQTATGRIPLTVSKPVAKPPLLHHGKRLRASNRNTVKTLRGYELRSRTILAKRDPPTVSLETAVAKVKISRASRLTSESGPLFEGDGLYKGYERRANAVAAELPLCSICSERKGMFVFPPFRTMLFLIAKQGVDSP